VTNFHEGLAKLAGTDDAARGTEAWAAAVDACLRGLEAPPPAGGARMCADGDTLRLNTVHLRPTAARRDA
jgi:hypothetical protein